MNQEQLDKIYKRLRTKHTYKKQGDTELDGTVEEFYSKRMSDDDLDAMAEALEIPE